MAAHEKTFFLAFSLLVILSFNSISVCAQETTEAAPKRNTLQPFIATTSGDKGLNTSDSQKRNQVFINRLEAMYDRLAKISDRISARLKKMGEQKQTTTARRELQRLNTQYKNLNTKLVGLSESLETINEATDSGNDEDLAKTGKEALGSLKEIHQAELNIVEGLKGLVGVVATPSGQ